MPYLRLLLLTALGNVLCLSQTDVAEAQLVRRFGGGGVQVNAPFVRVNVGPGGATSVRAPFTAVDSPGRIFVGRRRRLLARPQYAAPTQRTNPQAIPTEQQPEVADVDALPYPTSEQITQMDDAALVETLREMMARLHYRLSLLSTGEGWQDYLVLSREILGSPGAPPEAAQFGAIARIIPRYQSVQDNPAFVKIAELPSFAATFAALQEADQRAARFQPSGSEIRDPKLERAVEPQETPPAESLELLPTPQPTAVKPNPKRGERSILKRK